MELLKIIIIIAITMALSITLSIRTLVKTGESTPFDDFNTSNTLPEDPPISPNTLLLPSKRVSRFLAGEEDPRAADHCHKDNEICYAIGGQNSTCCNNKCIDLSADKNNCGKCKNKCKYTQACCRGQCVDLAFDKRHCGYCNQRCDPGEYCVYGLCNYA